MSRTFTDESTLTTLCPRCLNAFRNTRGIRVYPQRHHKLYPYKDDNREDVL